MSDINQERSDPPSILAFILISAGFAVFFGYLALSAEGIALFAAIVVCLCSGLLAVVGVAARIKVRNGTANRLEDSNPASHTGPQRYWRYLIFSPAVVLLVTATITAFTSGFRSALPTGILAVVGVVGGFWLRNRD